MSENEEPHLVFCFLLTGKTYDNLCSDNPNWFSIVDVIYGAHFSYSNMGNPGGLFDMIYMGSLWHANVQQSWGPGKCDWGMFGEHAWNVVTTCQYWIYAHNMTCAWNCKNILWKYEHSLTFDIDELWWVDINTCLTWIILMNHYWYILVGLCFLAAYLRSDVARWFESTTVRRKVFSFARIWRKKWCFREVTNCF